MGKEFSCNAGDMGLILGQEGPLRKAWQPTLVFLSGESHGQRDLAAYKSIGSQSQVQLKHLSTHAHTNT